jgi:uncharacterized protein YyaL (SSP411 family)
MVAAQITAQIKASADESLPSRSIDKDLRQRAVKQVAAVYDSEFAGFGAAPKFPRPGIFALLLAVAAGNDQTSGQALAMIRETLVAMSQGGIYDHVGGGFHRYSVDEQWQVPHFEKMLYTQALMSLAYARLYQIEPDKYFRDVVAGTLDFVIGEMRHPDGGFYSALDASSERPGQAGVHAEGAYYLWRAKQLASLLSKVEWDIVKRYYAIDGDGNIQSDPRGEFRQLNILHVSDAFKDRTLSDKEAALINSARQKLYQARLTRPRPHLDDKIITAWNGMMITALVEAAVVFEHKAYLQAAIGAADFIRNNLVDSQSHQLFRRLRDGEVGIKGTLDDYVWYVNGLLALYQHTNNRQWLTLAQQISKQQVQLFYDSDDGAFYESGPDKNVLFRSRSAYDGALPAPNAIAIENLTLLAELTGDKEWQTMANQTVSAFAGAINNDPAAAAWMVSLIRPAVDSE